MHKWAEVNVWDSWTKQDKIYSAIQDKRVALADSFTIFGVSFYVLSVCLNQFQQISSQLRLHAWTERFSQAVEEDRKLLLELTASSKRMEESFPVRRGHELNRSESLIQSDNAEDAMRVLQLVSVCHSAAIRSHTFPSACVWNQLELSDTKLCNSRCLICRRPRIS